MRPPCPPPVALPCQNMEIGGGRGGLAEPRSAEQTSAIMAKYDEMNQAGSSTPCGSNYGWIGATALSSDKMWSDAHVERPVRQGFGHLALALLNLPALCPGHGTSTKRRSFREDRNSVKELGPSTAPTKTGWPRGKHPRMTQEGPWRLSSSGEQPPPGQFPSSRTCLSAAPLLAPHRCTGR